MDLKLDQLDKLLELMAKHDVAVIDLHAEGFQLHVRRASDVPAPFLAGPASQPVHSAGAPVIQPAPAAGAPAAAAEPSVPARKLELVRSPMVGTFYSAPDPKSDPFVTVGSTVADGTTVCIIEAMKVMNEIKAGVSGKVVRLLAQNGKAVEFGQPLFEIEP